MAYSEDNKIQPVPPLPPEIQKAVSRRNLAVFIGAGVSQVIGCKSWGELAQRLVDKCYSTRKQNGERCLNFKQRETLSENNDYKRTITICYRIVEENGKVDAFYDVLRECLEPDQELLESKNIYGELYGLHGLFVTTNVDEHFDPYFEPQRIAYKETDFRRDTVDRNKLYHIHGSILDPDTVVLRLPEYMRRYQDNQFKDFLREIFENHVVLFVGYGMGEFELLDFLMIKSDSTDKKRLPRFMLEGYFEGEENILELNQHYYDEMGIRVVGYQMDDEGYGQLYEIIRRWNEEINQTSSYLYDSFDEIDEVVDNP